jgi:hypothetical protein
LTDQFGYAYDCHRELATTPILSLKGESFLDARSPVVLGRAARSEYGRLAPDNTTDYPIPASRSINLRRLHRVKQDEDMRIVAVTTFWAVNLFARLQILELDAVPAFVIDHVNLNQG